MNRDEQSLLDGLRALVDRASGGDPEQSMNIIEAAKFLGVGRSSLYRWRDEGILPSYKIGERVVFRRTDLISFRESFRERSAEA